MDQSTTNQEEEENKVEEEKDKFTCVSCMEELLKEDDLGYMSLQCSFHPNHSKGKKNPICQGCVKDYVKHTLKQGVFPVNCIYSCDCSIGQYDLKRIFSDEQETYLEYLDIITDRSLRKEKEYIKCSSVDCPYGELIIDQECDTRWTCKVCQKDTCTKHQIPYHEGQTCEEYDKIHEKEIEATEEWKKKHAVKCPKCGLETEHNGGCPEIICRCGHKWYWGEHGKEYYWGCLCCSLCLLCYFCCPCLCCLLCCGETPANTSESFNRFTSTGKNAKKE
mmetsp:Transcript_739/g.1142  ORF Transcript_739/g.1142 Transcript_739/m.1142 type:complete len:277 (-) Transcript_739:26-856(-)